MFVGIICLANLKMLFNLGVCQQFTLKRREVYLSITISQVKNSKIPISRIPALSLRSRHVA